VCAKSLIALENIANLRLLNNLKDPPPPPINSRDDYDAQTLELAAKLEREVEGLEQEENGADPKSQESLALVPNLSRENKSTGAFNLVGSFRTRPGAADIVPPSISLDRRKNSPVNKQEETKPLGTEISLSSQKYVALDAMRQEDDGVHLCFFRQRTGHTGGEETNQQCTKMSPPSRTFVTVDTDTILEFDGGIHPFWRHRVGKVLSSASDDGIPSAPPIEFKTEHKIRNHSPSAQAKDSEVFLSLDQCHDLLKLRSRNMAYPTLSELQRTKMERNKRAQLRRKKGLAALEEMVSFETINEFVIEERDVPSTSSFDSLEPKGSSLMFSGFKARNSVCGRIDIDPDDDMGTGKNEDAKFVCPNDDCRKRYRQVESLYRHIRQKHPKLVKNDEQQGVKITQPKGTDLSVVMALNLGVCI
jgi:hypothetical protein